MEKSRICDYLHDSADRLDEDCILCHEKKARRSHTRYVYDTPWDNEESEKPFCCEECGHAYLYGGDFSYFWCEPCGREICEQNPMNGWLIQYRIHDDEQICLRCLNGGVMVRWVAGEECDTSFMNRRPTY